jgi:TPR repeat protein
MNPTKSRRCKSLFVVNVILLFLPSLLHGSESSGGQNTTNSTNAIIPSGSPEDQLRLGRAYYRGEGVRQSYEKAGFWFRKAADQGNAKAMNNLGILYLEGQGTSKNEAEGYRWIRKAAEAGNSGAAYLMGILLIQGRGVDKNTTEGVAWLRKAADAGNTDALARLGQDTYFGDDGVTKDLKAAVVLIKAAAEKGNPWACETLGLLYLHGNGVPKDAEKANEWLGKGTHASLPL